MRGAFKSTASLALFIGSAIAQVPFAFDGHLDGMSLDSGGAFNAGGSISVNGHSIVIPKNFKFDFPAAYVPFAQLFDGTSPKDFPSPSTNKYEVSVVGNQVNGRLIAGKVDIAELGLQTGTGKISKVVSSANKGESWIEIENGPRLFINDPNSVYSSGYDKYPFFTADDENPSITGSTGFPMCIPRTTTAVDPLCPSSNRPSTTNRNFNAPAPMKMAPFIVGDYLTYSGVKVGDKDIACYSITANVGIFTPAGTKPAFLFVEDAIIGILTNDGNMEAAPSRFIGMASDPAAQINIFAVDVDPCTGEESERLLGNTSPRAIADDPRNKWEYRTNRGSIGKITREYRIKIASGQMKTDNNIIAGQYTTPASEIIFPEVTLPGYTDPPLDFTNFGYLTDGSGPEEGSTDIFGGLSPWPGANAPAAKDCPVITTPAPSPPTDTPPTSDTAPVANAGADFVTRPGVVITLSGRNTVSSIAAANVAFKWSQTAGPAAQLSSTTVANPTFTVPSQTGTTNTTRTFELTVTANGKTSKDTVDVISNNNNPDEVTILTYTWGSRQSGTIGVTARTNVVSPTVTMTIRVNNGAVQTMTPGGNGLYSFSSSRVNANTRIDVTSSLKGTRTTSTNTA